MPVRMTSTLRQPTAADLRPDEWESIEPQMDSELHRYQLDLLIACLAWWWRGRNDVFVTGNLTIFFSPDEVITEKIRGPDFFAVKGTDPRPRQSWMVWKENYKYPDIIIELLSKSTVRTDRTVKKTLYQDQFKTPEYFWYHPNTQECAGFRLESGHYQPIYPTEQGWRWSEQIELYLGIHNRELRFFTAAGELVPSPAERADQAEAHAQQAEQQARQAEAHAQQAEQRVTRAEEEAERLRQRLRELGLDP